MTATYILVPGAWLGSWAWADVTPALRAAGHTVYPMTLTGLADRSHLAGPDVTLTTHIDDIVNLVEWEDLSDVILVGHSYAGSVVTAAAGRISDRLAALVYVDSGPLPHGSTMLDFDPPEEQERTRAQVASEGDGYLLPPMDFRSLVGTPSGEGLTPPMLELLKRKATPQPFGTYTEPLDLGNQDDPPYRRALIACHEARALLDSGAPIAQMFSGPGWTVHDIPTGHWPMLSAPAALADALLAIGRT